jgi:Protein of unknown function (DUF2924)
MEWQARACDDLDQGFAWNGETYGSLSQVAKAMTGTSWNGHRFFGLRTSGPTGTGCLSQVRGLRRCFVRRRLNADQGRWSGIGPTT